MLQQFYQFYYDCYYSDSIYLFGLFTIYIIAFLCFCNHLILIIILSFIYKKFSRLFSDQVLERILFICSQESFAFIEDFEWCVHFCIQLFY